MTETRSTDHIQPVPRGIRNNNPGNILFNEANKWLGQLDPDEQGYCVFGTPEYGIRALIKCLRELYSIQGRRTVRSLISAWDGAKDSNVEAYVAAVAHWLGLHPDHDLISPNIIDELIRCIIHFENGQNPYSDAMLMRAFSLAVFL